MQHSPAFFQAEILFADFRKTKTETCRKRMIGHKRWRK